MTEARTQRRLAAILAADVVGYSRLMERDEAGTLAALKIRRRDVLNPMVAKHHGRIFKTSGDGALIEFASAVNAVQCAVDLQDGMAATNDALPEDRRIVLRIGGDVGDVLIEGSDLYGDCVNIAARLEALADPGDILVSGAVHDHTKNKIEVGFNDLGAQSLKNISEPIRVYRVTRTPAVRAGPANASDPKPSIAVLPFANLSGDPGQKYFSDGITDDVVTELTRFKSIPVIAHNSSAKFSSQAADIESLRRSLGVEYIVQGSVRKVEGQIRINVQLVDARSGGYLWSERYDRNLEDVFSAQDEIVALIVGVIEGRVIAAGAERSARKPPSNMHAYDHVLRALALPPEDPDAEAQIVHFLGKAIDLAPTYGLPHALLAEREMLSWFSNTNRQREDLDAICKMAEKAVKLDDGESISHSILSWIYLYRQSYDLAEFHSVRALTLTPNRSQVLADRAELLTLLGRPLEAVASLNRARELDPYHPKWFWWSLARAYYVAGEYRPAIAELAHVSDLPFFAHAYAAACHAQLGQVEPARSHADRVVQLRPDFSLHRFMETEPFKRESDTAHMLDGLRKAGLPE